MQHLYDPAYQNQSLALRTTAALDKLADVFKTLLWESQKEHQLSPLQQKLLIFVASHKPEENTVSNLVQEFNLTKATVSDCISTLVSKKWLNKQLNHKDNRRFYIELTAQGEEKLKGLSDFSEPLQKAIAQDSEENLKEFYKSLYNLLGRLNQPQLATLNRSCLDCQAYRSDPLNYAFCMQLRIQLPPENRRLDCPEYISKKNKSLSIK